MSNTVFLSLGSNLGDREHYLSKAIEMISAMEGFELLDLSSVYANPASDMEPESPGYFITILLSKGSARMERSLPTSLPASLPWF